MRYPISRRRSHSIRAWSVFTMAGVLAALGSGCQRENADRATSLAPPDAATDRAAPPGAGSDRAAQPPVAVASRAEPAELPRTVAQANLEPTAGNDARGMVFFSESGNTVTIDIRLSGLSPGPHGIHVHEFGDCSGPGAASAGKHLNPHDAPHGAPTNVRDARHPGDLGNVVADQMGNVRTSIQDSVLGSEPDFQMIGHAIVVHEDEDDLKSQPSGDSGMPVACGVIEAAPGGGASAAPRPPG